MAVDHISSLANPFLKQIRKAQSAGTLTEDGSLIAEGPHLVDEIARTALPVRCLIFATGTDVPPGLEAARVIEVPPRVFSSISGTETPQGILALLEPPQWAIDAITGGPQPLAVILDAVSDPGNVGAIARSAEAFGATGLIFLDGCANPWSPKSLRASAGSLLRLPVVRMDRRAFTPSLPLFAGSSDRGALPWNCNFAQPCALVVGSEGRGVSPELLSRSEPVRIPTSGVESLNAAVAASLLLYEAARQRSGIH